MNRKTLTTITAGLALLLLPSLAAAQAPTTQQNGVTTPSIMKGLSLGIHGATTALPRRHTTDAGLALAVGYGVADRLALHALTTGSWVNASGDRDSFFQSHSDLEARLIVGRTNSRLLPHLAIGVSGRATHEKRSAEQGGGTDVQVTVRPTTGGGISYFLSRSTALDASVRYTFRDADRTRMYFGVSWFPGAR